MGLALEGQVQLKWSQQVQEEWIRNFLKNNSSRLGLDGEERLKAIPQTMLTALEFQEPLVQGYQYLLERIKLPDENDRHVVAAAFWGGAEAILTFNAKDFPEEALDPGDLRVVDPDDYLCEFAEEDIRKNLFAPHLASSSQKTALQAEKPTPGRGSLPHLPP